MSLPHAAQPSTMPIAYITRKALTTPSGRLKEGVSVDEYVAWMETAERLDRKGIRNRVETHADAEKLAGSLLAAARTLSVPA